MAQDFDIRNYGASADAGAINTAAIQAAIDACHAAGGGTVLCPPGVFVTGTLWLKSHVTLNLEAGCTLLGSGDRADYVEGHDFPESQAFAQERVSDAHLILAYRAENVTLTGRGTIDGNSRAFLPFLDPSAGEPATARKEWKWRPGQMVFFCRCRDVSVSGLRLINSPYWTLFLHGCEQVRVHGVSIDNPRETPCGDGLDLDCCREVTVDSCRISTGDDSITLRANARPLGAEAFACENVAITNCVLHTRCNAVRIGVGGGVIRNCVLSNLLIRESSIGVNVVSRYPGTASSVEIRNIRLSNLEIDALMPIYLSTGAEGDAPVSDIALSDIGARGRTLSYIGGNAGNPIRNITLHNVDLTMAGGKGNAPPPAGFHLKPEWELRTMGAPYALCVAEAGDVLLQNFRVRWGELTGRWQHALLAMNTSGLALSHFDAASPPSDEDASSQDCGDSSAIHCVGCSGLHLRSCRAEAGTGCFLHVTASPPDAAVRLLANDFSLARDPLHCDARILEGGNLYLREHG